MNKIQLRELNRSRHSTILEYLKSIKELGLVITNANEGIAHTEWAERVKQQVESNNNYPIMVEALYYTDGASIRLDNLENHILNKAGLEHTWNIDIWREKLMESYDALNEITSNLIDPEYRSPLWEAKDILRTQLRDIDTMTSEVCEELDDIYLELLQAKDLWEFQNKIGVYKEEVQ